MVMAALYEGYKTLRESILKSMSPKYTLPITVSMSTNKTMPEGSRQQLNMDSEKASVQSQR